MLALCRWNVRESGRVDTLFPVFCWNLFWFIWRLSVHWVFPVQLRVLTDGVGITGWLGIVVTGDFGVVKPPL